MPETASGFPSYIVAVLRQGGVGVILTDTIYGIVGSARNKDTVERVYRLRKRSLQQPNDELLPARVEVHLNFINKDDSRRSLRGLLAQEWI